MSQSFIKKIFLPFILTFTIGNAMAHPEEDKGFAEFDVGKAGASASLEIHVSAIRLRATLNNPQEVALIIIPPNNNPENAVLAEKYKKLFKDLTGKNYIYSGDTLPLPHKGIRVRVTWKRANGEIIRQREVYSDDGIGRIKVRGGASFTLDGANLPPGDYVVVVEAMTDDPRFDGSFKTGICTGIFY